MASCPGATPMPPPRPIQRVPYLRAPHETQFGLTTWDRQDRPQGVELRDFSQVLGQMDLTNLEPEPASAGIIVPHEWSKPHGDFSDMGIKGTSPIPYVSTQDGGVVSGSENRDQSELNRWLVGAWLSALILGRQAGLKVEFLARVVVGSLAYAVATCSPDQYLR